MTANGEMDQLKEIAGCGFLQKPILQRPWTDGDLAEEVTPALV